MSGEEQQPRPDVSLEENETPRKDGKRRRRRQFVTIAESVRSGHHPSVYK